jgi:hypothetical protein
MCMLLILTNTLDEVETRVEGLADKFNNVAGYSSGKHHVLAVDDLWV